MSIYSTLEREQEREVPPPAHSRRLHEPDSPEGEHSQLRLWLAICALTAGLIGGGWYGYSRLAGHDSLLRSLSGWPAELAAVRQNVDATMQRLAGLPGEIRSLGERVTSLDRKLSTDLARAQKRAREMNVGLLNEVASARQETRAAAAAQEEAFAARFRELESQRQFDAARTAQLEQQVTLLKARLANDLDNVRSITTQNTEQLRQELRQTDGRVTQVASFNNRARERFVAARGRTQQIAPGMLLHIARVDPLYRRFSGWIELAGEGKFVWLRNQTALRAIPVFTHTGALQHDLVVTGLNSGGVTGYIIFPREGELRGAELASRSGGVN